jgi:anti-sigma regulatory factor (Ser/Thr protein kinase)
MCRMDKAEFAVGSLAPSQARHWVSEVLNRWEANVLTESANLLTSELVSNTVRHAHSGASITAAIADGFLEVGVFDAHTDSLPRVGSTSDPTAVGGRGIAIVEALAASWGVQVLAEGKQVWFRLEAADWSFLPACRCSDNHHVNRVILGSGHELVPNAGPWDGVSQSPIAMH